MDKKIGVSILFGFFLLVGLFGLTKIAEGELDTDVVNTNIYVYGEGPPDNITTSKSGAIEMVNITIATVSTNSAANITNITVYLDSANYTFMGFNSPDDHTHLAEINNSDFIQNATVWGGDGNIALWNCYNLSLYIVNCMNAAADTALSPDNTATVNRSLILRFNVTATSDVGEGIAEWTLNTTDSDTSNNNNVNSTVLYTYVDGLAPRIISVNVTDGNVVWDNATSDDEVARMYEVNGSGDITVNVNIQEMNPESTSVFLIYSNNDTNATEGPGGFTWNTMTESVAPGWDSTGVYTYSYSVADAATYGNHTNFIIVVNDTYNHENYINGSGKRPFSFYPNNSIVNVVSVNVTTILDGFTKTITNPVSSTSYVAAINATIDIVVAGENKGDLVLHYKEDEDAADSALSLNSYANKGLTNANWSQVLYTVAPDGEIRNTTAVINDDNAIYSWSIDFAGNNSKNPYIALLINSSQSTIPASLGGDAFADAENYTAYAIYNFGVDSGTPTPTLTVPSDRTVEISSTTGITYTCKTGEALSGVNQYTWTLTKPNGDTDGGIEVSSNLASDEKTYSGDDINQAGTYNIKCEVRDAVGNKAFYSTNEDEVFVVSYSTVTGTSSSGGGGAGATPTVSFDVDFSTATTGTIKAQQGRVKSFSFDGATKHTVTFDKVTASSITVTIASNPVTINLNLRETKEVDVNGDGINDISVTLKSIVNGLANVEIVKIEAGAQVIAREEKEAAGIVDEPTTTEPSGGATPIAGSNTWLWVTLLIIVVIIGVGYYSYKKK